MLLHLTEFSEETLHEQITRQVTDKIMNGDLSDGAALLSVRQLARSQHVSVLTVQKAYEELERNGLIATGSGNGFFVAPLTPAQKAAIERQRYLRSHSGLTVVESLSKALISVFDPQRLMEIIREIIMSHFHIRSVTFVLLDDRTGDYTVMPDFPSQEKVNIPPTDPLIQQLRHHSEPLKRRSLPGGCDRSFLTGQLEHRHVRLIVPLQESSRLIGIMGLGERPGGHEYSREDRNLLTVLINQFVTALTTARFYVEAVEKRRFEEELIMARQIQSELLPKTLPQEAQFSMAGFSEPSRFVGGDYFDVIGLDNDLRALVIGDACGKGLPAALLIAQVQAMIRSELNHGLVLDVMMENINNQLIRMCARDKFVTLFFALYHAETGSIRYVSAGHHYPLIVKKSGHCRWLDQGGPALGLTTDSKYIPVETRLDSEDALVLYTDGVTELMDSAKQEYGENRMKRKIKEYRESGATEMLKAVLDDQNQFSQGMLFQDDRTLLILKHKG